MMDSVTGSIGSLAMLLGQVYGCKETRDSFSIGSAVGLLVSSPRSATSSFGDNDAASIGRPRRIGLAYHLASVRSRYTFAGSGLTRGRRHPKTHPGGGLGPAPRNGTPRHGDDGGIRDQRINLALQPRPFASRIPCSATFSAVKVCRCAHTRRIMGGRTRQVFA
jgi:hypothetical protein